MIDYRNQINPLSLEELQNNARIKNDEELDKLCNNICICMGWISFLTILFYIIMIIILSRQNISNNDQNLYIIEEYLSSNSK